MSVEMEFNEDALQNIVESLEAFAVVGYTADHAPHVNFETRWTGNPPPFQPLREWVGRKWGDLDGGLKEAALTDEDGNDRGIEPGSDAHKRAVTWMVVFSIAANGIEGIHFGERALSEGKNKAATIAMKYENSDNPNAPLLIIQDLADLMFGVSQDIVAEEAVDTGALLQSGFVEVSDEPLVRGEK